MTNPISLNSPALRRVQQRVGGSQLVNLETPLLELIPVTGLIQIFLEEIVLVSPYELARRGWASEALHHLRIADISPEFIELEWLQRWLMSHKDMFTDITITALEWLAQTNANCEDVYCGESDRFQAWGIPRAELTECRVYTPLQLGQWLYERSLVPGGALGMRILCCLPSPRQSLSAALQLRQEGYLAQALTEPPLTRQV